MRNLNTHLSREAVKSNKKLQEIKSQFLRYYDPEEMKWTITHKNNHDGYFLKEMKKAGEDFYYAPTIADILDNAEKLFGKERCCSICNEPHRDDLPKGTQYTHDCNEVYTRYKSKVMQIIFMCWDNEPQEKIEQYIINNLK